MLQFYVVNCKDVAVQRLYDECLVPKLRLGIPTLQAPLEVQSKAKPILLKALPFFETKASIVL